MKQVLRSAQDDTFLFELSSGALSGCGAGFVAVDGVGITRDPCIEAFGDALAVLRLFELGGVLLVGDEADLGKDGGHVGANEDDEGRLFDAAVVEAGVALGEAGIERGVDVGGELFGFVDLVFERDLFDEVGEVMDALVGDGVLTGGDAHGIRV